MNKKYQHRQPDESLSLSDNGDEEIIAKIRWLINNYTPKPPYRHNVLIRIKYLLEDVEG